MTGKSFWSFLFNPKIWRGFPTNRPQRSSSADPQSFRKHWTQGKGKRTSQRCTRRREHCRAPENKEHHPRRGKRRTEREQRAHAHAESSSHLDGVATAESRIMITSGDPQPPKRMDATEFSEEYGAPRKVQKVKRSIASPADILRRASRVPSPRTSVELKDKFLSHCSQISAGNHTQIIGDPIGAVEVKVLTSQTHTYKLCRVWYVT